MGDLNFQFGGGNSQSKALAWTGRIFLFLFATPFAAFGLFAAWSGAKKIIHGDWQSGLGLMVFGLIFAGIGLGLMYAAATADRRKKAADAKWLAQTDGGQKVWMARADWAAGKIKSSAGSQWKIFLLMGAMFCLIGIPASYAVLRDELPKGNHAAAFVLIFPLCGLGFLVVVVRGYLAHRRFGNCCFELAQVPVPLGGALDGLIQTERPFSVAQDLHLKLTCLRRTVSGSGDNRSVQETVLWQNEKVFGPNASLPANGSGTGIPVHFAVPADQPESSLHGSSTIIWRLDARAKMQGPDFVATFDLPVFRVAGTLPAADTDADPTAPFQISAEELRRDEHSKIQVSFGPNGREFYFPAARNLGTAIMVTIILAVWSGFIWMMIVKHAPLLFPIVFGLFDIVLLWSFLSLWFKSSRVTVNRTEVRWQNRWLVFGRTRSLAASEVLGFAVKPGMTSGQTVFYDLKLTTRANQDDFASRKAMYQQTGVRPAPRFRVFDPSGFTVGSSVHSKLEADWLAQEMTKALGRGA